MKRPERRGYYPLDELMERDRRDFPDGRTLAVKRAAFPGMDGQGGRLARLNIVDAMPEEYVIDNHTLATGLAAAIVPLSVEQASLKKVDRRVNGKTYTVEALRFAGQITLPEHGDVPAIGACVRGELATGFVHILDASRSAVIFRPLLEAEAELELPLPIPEVEVQERELAFA